MYGNRKCMEIVNVQKGPVYFVVLYKDYNIIFFLNKENNSKF